MFKRFKYCGNPRRRGPGSSCGAPSHVVLARGLIPLPGRTKAPRGGRMPCRPSAQRLRYELCAARQSPPGALCLPTPKCRRTALRTGHAETPASIPVRSQNMFEPGADWQESRQPRSGRRMGALSCSLLATSPPTKHASLPFSPPNPAAGVQGHLVGATRRARGPFSMSPMHPTPRPPEGGSAETSARGRPSQRPGNGQIHSHDREMGKSS
jgi:hypothetical protein